MSSIDIQGVSRREEGEMVAVTIGSSAGEPVTISALPDSGAQIDAIPSDLYQKFFSSVPLKASGSAETATVATIVCKGTFPASIEWKANDKVVRPIDTRKFTF